MKLALIIMTTLILFSCDESNKSGGKKSITLPACDVAVDANCQPQREELPIEQAPITGARTQARVTSNINMSDDSTERRSRKIIDILENVSDQSMVFDLEDCSLALQAGSSLKVVRIKDTLRVVDESGVHIYQAVEVRSDQGIFGKWREVVELENKMIRTILNISRNKLSIRRTCVYR